MFEITDVIVQYLDPVFVKVYYGPKLCPNTLELIMRYNVNNMKKTFLLERNIFSKKGFSGLRIQNLD